MRVLKASWEITRRCNADCAHCYVDGSHDLGELSERNADILLRRLFDGGVRFLTLVGGEPCVAQTFDHVVDKAIELGFACKTITNGTVLRQRLTEHNRSGRLEVIVSVLAGTPASFAKAYRLDSRLFESQRRLLTDLTTFSVNLTMFSANSRLGAADEIAEYLAPFRHKIQDVSVFFATPNGRGIQDQHCTPRDTQQRLTRQMIGRLADVGIIADFNVDCAGAGSCPLIGATVPGEVFVNPRGQIRPCHALVGYETDASLLDVPLRELLASSVMRRWKGNDTRFAFDRRCKAALMQSGIRPEYVEESGGVEAFKRIEIKLSPDLVLERDAETWYGYLRTRPVLLELNEDARTLITLIQKGEWKSLIETLDHEELVAVVEVIREAEEAGFLSVARPSVRPGPLPGRALSDHPQSSGDLLSDGKEVTV